ncbi:MAG: protein translocase subunit SecD [Gammaproteobacteria bacterium]|nr:MAG: protein translocase subunit SecD [Gammaproteobacteria bacterium]
MNQYPLWKNLAIVLVLLVGIIYALPNIYGEDPALQITSARAGKLDASLAGTVTATLEDAGIAYRNTESDDQQILVRFNDTGAQLKAMDFIKAGVGSQYVVALNLAPATPEWLQSLNALPMYLGLDLRGGVHFLMEVDMDAATGKAIEGYAGDARSLLRGEKIRYLTIRAENDALRIMFRSPEDRERANSLLGDELPGLMLDRIDAESGEVGLYIRPSEQELRDIRKFALQQNIMTLRNRVNELGVAEPVIQQQGTQRIVVQLPGVQDTARAKRIIGATATLEYRAVDTEHDIETALAGKVPAGSKLYYDRNGSPVLLKKRVIVTGDQIINAGAGFDQQSGTPNVTVMLDAKGARKMLAFTKESVGKPMAVVFIENKTQVQMVDGKPVRSTKKIEEVVSVATIRDVFSKRFQTTGLDSPQEAHELALVLRSGALAAPVEIIEERTIGPSMGKENIEQGFKSVVIGFCAVLIFMAIYYRVFGLVANLALTVNLVLIVAVLSLLQATLTLPGIAGIVLTVGMAVDANVLIFERIREELRNGNSPQASIQAGYEKAFSTIADANITTLIAAIVLLSFGTGPIKGFAVTLSIGIMTSMFTAIMGTRAVINLIYGRRRVASLMI